MTPPRRLVPWLVLACWLAIVVFTATRHEFWRDEVRALSLVRAAGTPLDLYRLIEYDGHPLLWYLLLYAGTLITDSALILPITSIVVATAAVALFLRAAPFPLWFRGLFVFSALPLYEYSVVARNYGISMLLLFAAAAWNPSKLTHPVRFGLVLALLANTNVHSAMLTGLVVLLWILDAWRGRASITRAGALAGGVAVAIGGIAFCALLALPRRNTILTTVRSAFDAGELGTALIRASLLPAETFGAILPEAVPVALGSVAFFLALAGLVRRPELFAAGLAAMVGLGTFFRIIYPGFYRHQGLLLVFLLFLYWISRQPGPARPAPGPAGERPRRPATRLVHAAGLYIGLLFLIVANVAEARHAVLNDVRGEKSSSRAFGAFLSSPVYRQAVLVPEPGHMLEALPYYAANTIYLPRERRYSPTVSWTTDSRQRFTLEELLAEARGVASQHPDRPVLIVLFADLLERPAGEWTYMYQATFTWTPEEVEALRRATREVAVFDTAYEDERYRVLELVRD